MSIYVSVVKILFWFWASPDRTWFKQYLNRHTRKAILWFPVCGSSDAHAHSPIWATDMRYFLKLPQALCYMSANSKGSGETALMRLVISTFFSYAGPFIQCLSRAPRGSVRGFLVFLLQITTEPFALFHHHVFDYTKRMCFAVMFHIWGRWFFCCSSSFFVRLWFHVWHLFCH